MKIPIAAYKSSVSRFAPLKLRDSNSASGSIGEFTVASINTKATRHPKPAIRLPKTNGLRQPKLTDSMSPTINPPIPDVENTATNQPDSPPSPLMQPGIPNIALASTHDS